MKYELTQHAKEVMRSRDIKVEWVSLTVDSPSAYIVITDMEVHFFKPIEEALDKCLKVVVNPISLKIITAYFDRNMKKKGCK